jgi:TetR/AcrR family transcriptional repressor of the ameABC operon
MARPQTDIEAGKQQLLEVVDDLVRRRGGADISMTELASAAGMSPSNIYRFFESKEALLEAVAEKWFAEKIRIMEEVAATDLPARDKMLAFFARRFAVMVEQYEAEPELFKSYLEIGQQNFEVVRGYVDLGDHYLAMIVAEAMEQGYFDDLSIDQTVSLINQMVQPYCNPEAIVYIGTMKLNEQKLSRIIDTIFIGLGKSFSAKATSEPHIKIVS